MTIGTGGGAVTLVADIGQYRPFGDELALGVTVFDGIGATTVQDFAVRGRRQQGRISSGAGPSSAGALALDQLTALLDLLQTWGASQPLEDDMGNEGTIKATHFSHAREVGSAAQGALFSYDLRWQWVTLTSLYGTAFTEP